MGFLIFACAGFYMFSRPYAVTIEHRGHPYTMVLYRDFYVGLPYFLVGVILMVAPMFVKC